MRGSSDHPEFVHPALRSEGLASRGRPGPGGLMGGGDGEGKLFYGEEGRQMRKPMEFRVRLAFFKESMELQIKTFVETHCFDFQSK